MDARLIERIETGVEQGASALFGSAVGYAVFAAMSGSASPIQLAAFVGAGAGVAYLLCARALGTISSSGPQWKLSPFRVDEIETVEDELLLTDADRIDAELVLTDADRLNDELVLTEADRIEDELLLTDVDRIGATPADLLVLDDILAEIGPDSRVVRLFDRKSMPTPGQLKSKIDSHLDRAPQSAASEEAAQALSDALAELRRSLR